MQPDIPQLSAGVLLRTRYVRKRNTEADGPPPERQRIIRKLTRAGAKEEKQEALQRRKNRGISAAVSSSARSKTGTNLYASG